MLCGLGCHVKEVLTVVDQLMNCEVQDSVVDFECTRIICSAYFVYCLDIHWFIGVIFIGLGRNISQLGSFYKNADIISKSKIRRWAGGIIPSFSRQTESFPSEFGT
jgi:hypothetical protein